MQYYFKDRLILFLFHVNYVKCQLIIFDYIGTQTKSFTKPEIRMAINIYFCFTDCFAGPPIFFSRFL